MPTISRERVPFIQKNGATEFVREIKVSSTGTFSIALPSDVVEALNVDTLYGQTRGEVLKKWTETLAQFHAKKAVTRRIIAYRFGLWGELGSRDAEDNRNPIRYGDTNHYQWDRRPGLGLALEVSVFDETEVVDGKSKGYRYEEAASAIQTSARLSIDELNSCRDDTKLSRRWKTQLPWTAEREAFFVRLVGGLENLLIELHGAFADADDVKKLVDGKRGLFLLK